MKKPKNLQKSKPLGACLFLASRPMCNITSRTIRRHDEAKTRPAGRFEDPGLQDIVQALTGRQRVVWARAGCPTDAVAIATVLNTNQAEWDLYREGQHLRRLMAPESAAFDELVQRMV